jgi:hypothetical protein
LGAFFAGLAFLPDLPLAGATWRERAPAVALFVAFGCSAVAVAAVSCSVVADVIFCSPLAMITVTTSITRVRPESKSNLREIGKGDGTAMAAIPRSRWW